MGDLFSDDYVWKRLKNLEFLEISKYSSYFTTIICVKQNKINANKTRKLNLVFWDKLGTYAAVAPSFFCRIPLANYATGPF